MGCDRSSNYTASCVRMFDKLWLGKDVKVVVTNSPGGTEGNHIQTSARQPVPQPRFEPVAPECKPEWLLPGQP
jgi:hypothetical protein